MIEGTLTVSPPSSIDKAGHHLATPSRDQWHGVELHLARWTASDEKSGMEILRYLSQEVHSRLMSAFGMHQQAGGDKSRQKFN